MAEERVSEIVVPLRYELQDADLKKMDSQMKNLGRGKGITQSKRNFAELRTLFSKMADSFSLDDEKVVGSYNKVVKQILKAKNQLSAVDVTKAKWSTARADYLTNPDDKKAEEKYRIALANKRKAQEQFRSEVDNTEASLKNLLVVEDKARYSKIIQAEKEVADAAKQAAKEQEEAKKRVKKAWQDLGDTFTKLPKKIRQGIMSLAATMYVFRRIFSAIRTLYSKMTSFIKASSAWVENLNLLEVVFGDVSKNAEETKKQVYDLASKFSMDANKITQFISTFKQMANAMGQTAEMGALMSQVLVQLGLDISSLRNVKTETAMSDLASAIAGQIKPVRKYGFDVTQQSINALLQESGVGGTVTTLSQADKQLARTILLIRQSRDAWGDLGKTINTFANQQRILEDQLETTKRLIGQVLLGTFQFGDSLEKASQTAGIGTRIIWQINGALIAFNSVLDAVVPKAESVNGALAGLNEDLQDDLEETQKAAEGALASFDKFNVMSSGSSTATGTTLEGVFGKEAAQYIKEFQKRSQQVMSYAKEIATTYLEQLFPAFKEWRNGDNTKVFADWVKGAGKTDEKLLSIKETIKSITNTLANISTDFINNLPNLLQGIWSIVDALYKLFKPILDIIIKLTTNTEHLDVLIKAIFWTLVSLKGAGIIKGVFTGLADIIKSVKILRESSKIVKPIIDGISNAFTNLGGTANGVIQSIDDKMGHSIGTIGALTLGFASLAGGISSMSKHWNDMSTAWKVATIAGAALTSVLVGIAVAKAAIASGLEPITAAIRGLAVGAMLAGGILMLGSQIGTLANKHAQGGYQTGGLFYAGENGAEWVGRQGNTSTIVNDKQMSDIMQQSVAMGVVQGNRMSNAGRTAGGDGKVAVVNLDGKKLFEVVEYNGKKVGKVFAEA